MNSTAAVTGLKVDGDGADISWAGEISDPLRAEDLVNQGLTPEQARATRSNLFRLDISAIRYVYDETTGTSRRFDVAPKNLRSSVATYYEAEAEFFSPRLNTEYKIRALEMDPRYHVLIEIDQGKMIRPGPFDDPDSPEMGVKRRQYVEFINALGEDPRDAARRQE